MITLHNHWDTEYQTWLYTSPQLERSPNELTNIKSILCFDANLSIFFK